jgi:serine/threonine-protein kinase
MKSKSFLDEVSTFSSAQFDDEEATYLQTQRADRTMIELEDPEPTMPPEEPKPRPTVVELVSARTGSALDRYEIDRLLGEGAFGRVFAARDKKLGRKVALKLLHKEYMQNPEIRQRFLQEAHAAACIQHPGIVTMFDVGDESLPYISMELLAGYSLLERLDKHGLFASDTVREIGRQAASALDAAHRHGVLHRDLKPENIFVVPDPAAVGGERVKVLDFGLAKPTQTASVKTRAATVFGTPLYMGPEQFTPAPNTDPRSDIYALGCVLFQLATGRPPYKGSLREVVTAHRESPVPSLREFVPDACEHLDRVIQKMLAKDLAVRFQTMAGVELALRALAPATAPTPVPASKPAPEPASASGGTAPKVLQVVTAVAVAIAAAALLAFF